jgi:uncharacterized protein GlcG (DUF336 family)
MVELTLNKARMIVRNAIKKGRELNLKPLSVVVLDSGGHVIAFERENYASPGRFDIARGKAYGSIMLGMSGTAQMARAEAQQYFMNAVNGLFDGKVIPVPGGVLIKNKNKRVIGAVGVTGDSSDNDAIVAMQGVTFVGLSGDV